MIVIFWFKIKSKRPSVSKSLLEIKEDLIKAKPQPKPSLSNDDIVLVEKIKMKTNGLNTNNVTRTKAYFDFYRLHPEIHWAFLGHMVSRNGGWNMTDLKGDFISNLLEKQAKFEFFSFLERGNWLIFQDVYPQFMLYEESVKRNQSMFHLLNRFGISKFMEIVWSHFWSNRNPYVLTMALVVNEQSYLENQVMKNVHYKDKVFNTFEFKLQEQLAFNHILFPYENKENTMLIGQTINRFDSLHERIMLGKRLYSLLFSNNHRLKQAENWASSHPHTGSRKDYWPHLFNDLKEYAPGGLFVNRLKNCQLRKGAARIYSPKLEFAWKNVNHEPAMEEDWFKDWSVLGYLDKDDNYIDGEIEHEYCETLKNLELATIAKKAIFL